MNKENNNACNICKYKGRVSCKGCSEYYPSLFSKKENEFYPLELEDRYINLWSEDGSSKWTIALFIYDEGEGSWHLEFIGARPIMNSRIKWDHFQNLIISGYTQLKNRVK